MRLTDEQRAFLRSNVRCGPHSRNIERLIDAQAKKIRDLQSERDSWKARADAARGAMEAMRRERDEARAALMAATTW